MTEPRRTFGPVLLLGAAAGTLAAVAGNKPWLALDPEQADPLGVLAEAGRMPLASALALVVLACWGVLLVTRRRVRRAVAVLGLLAALGGIATVVAGVVTLRDGFPEPAALQERGRAQLAWTGWFWAAGVGSVLSAAATAAAVRFVPHWPEMGTRYDAPGAPEARTPDPAEGSSLDLWRAMDEGRDPTA